MSSYEDDDLNREEDFNDDLSYGSYEEEEYDQFDDDDDIDSTINNETRLQRQQESYTIINQDDILKRQQEAISRISTVLSIPPVSASILLRHYKWNVGEANDAWFADEEGVRKAVGLLEGPLVDFPDDKELICGICFDPFVKKVMNSVACGHPFCSTCWRGYLGTAIKDGQGCLTLRCPEPSCRAAIDQDMVDLLGSEEEKSKYSNFLLRSYVESKPTTKWCPALDCTYAVDFVVGSASSEVYCNCRYHFCWICTQEAHRPVDCATVEKWVMKNNSESENMNWILTNSKACPKCKRYIEKNQGCMHMTCTPPCKFEFCWLCLGDWRKHSEQTGGYYACNVYKKEKDDGTYSEEERKREMAKSSLEKYTHYYERWDANNKSRKKAQTDLNKTQTVDVAMLMDAYGETEQQLQFLVDAWLQIIECRRVLKWTYAYGYYIPDDEGAKKQFFEYLQSEAEAALERLHGCVEKDLAEHIKSIKDISQKLKFGDFRSKLTGLTSVTRDYFENLVRAMENGLSDVDSRCPVRPKSPVRGGEGDVNVDAGEGNEITSSTSSSDEDGE